MSERKEVPKKNKNKTKLLQGMSMEHRRQLKERSMAKMELLKQSYK